MGGEGFVGLGILFFCVILVINKINTANEILWRLQAQKPASFRIHFTKIVHSPTRPNERARELARFVFCLFLFSGMQSMNDARAWLSQVGG